MCPEGELQESHSFLPAIRCARSAVPTLCWPARRDPAVEMVLTRKRQAQDVSPAEPQPVLEQELGRRAETPQPPRAKKRRIRDPLAVTRHQTHYAAPSQHAQCYLEKRGLTAKTTKRKAALSARGKKLAAVRKAKKKAYEDSKRNRQGSTRPPGRVSGAMTRTAIAERYVRVEGSPP